MGDTSPGFCARHYPDLAAEFWRVMRRQLPKGWDADLPTFTPADGPMATRIASGKTIAVLGSRLPELMGGSADLAPSTHTNMDGAGNFEPENWAGRNMHFGIREHAMGAISERHGAAPTASFPSVRPS